jgi:hypothetical protein
MLRRNEKIKKGDKVSFYRNKIFIASRLAPKSLIGMVYGDAMKIAADYNLMFRVRRKRSLLSKNLQRKVSQ